MAAAASTELSLQSTRTSVRRRFSDDYTFVAAGHNSWMEAGGQERRGDWERRKRCRIRRNCVGARRGWEGGNVWMVARSDKWIIPRYGVGVPAIRQGDAAQVVNDEFLEHVRTGRCVYVRGDPVRCTKNGVVVNDRKRGMKLGDRGREIHLDADIIVLATGFEKPDISFLDDGLFPDGYERPDLYLQNFSTEDWSILMTNSAYQNAIGTV
ncbi:FAD/NAD(P)-binding domain-containing protein [Salix suchowensis]|nr:FAD/NAD(P)-binding domain-containing protein [Salix suchowensis]